MGRLLYTFGQLCASLSLETGKQELLLCESACCAVLYSLGTAVLLQLDNNANGYLLRGP